MNRSLTIIYSTSTGHTEFVIDALIEHVRVKKKDLHIVKQRAEVTKPEDLTKADILLLACGSWNTGNVEGQLQPYMYDLVNGRGQEADLKDKPAAAIGLGDERYHYTARAAEKLTEFLTQKQAKILLPTLKVVNDPFDQATKVLAWADELLKQIDKLPSAPAPAKKK